MSDRPSVTDNARAYDARVEAATRIVAEHPGYEYRIERGGDVCTGCGAKIYSLDGYGRHVAERTLAAGRGGTTTEQCEPRLSDHGQDKHCRACGVEHPAETTDEDALDAATDAVEAEIIGINAGSEHGARDVAEAAIEAYLLARPLPDRDELAEAISDSDTVPCDVCADSRCRYCWGDACRKADAVLDLLRGGESR